MQLIQVLFFVLQHIRKNAVNFSIFFFLLISHTLGINRETISIVTIPLWENIVLDFFGRKVEPLPGIQFNGLNLYTYNRGYLINKVYFYLF